MYGLLLQAALEFITSKFSSEIAQTVLAEAAGSGLDGRIGLGRAGFSIHQLYSDKLLIRLAQCTAEATNLRLDQVMEQFGHFFVRYTHQAGYEALLRVLGRSLSDFVLGLDNLHEYFRGTYPKIKAPSFSVVNEDVNGMTICYRSIRGNLHGYVAGQLSEVARLYYAISIAVSVQSQTIDSRGKYSVIMRLDFENSGFANRRGFRVQMPLQSQEPPILPPAVENPVLHALVANSRTQIQKLSIPSNDNSPMRQQKANTDTLFDKISFYVILNREFEVVSAGRGVNYALPGVVGRDFNEVFELIRPAIPSTWSNVLDFANNVFEVHSLQPIQCHHDEITSARGSTSQPPANQMHDSSVSDRVDRFIHLRLRGQMIHFEEWDCLMFLAMPIIDNLKELNMLGLKIHDLSMMDSSRELITMRHHRDIGKDPLMVQEAKVGNKLDSLSHETNMFRQRRVTLLEEAIPKFVLKSSDKLVQTHYSDKVAVITCALSFMKTVNSPPIVKEAIMTLNSLFRKFDAIIVKYSVSKVLSSGNDYQMLIGLPFHATLPANLAILIAEELIDAADVGSDQVESTSLSKSNAAQTNASGRRLRKTIISDLQISCDIGPVIGGVLGVTIPRFLACGRPVTISQRIAHIAIPNTVTVTENVVHELKKNEFALNYEYKSLVTIQLPVREVLSNYENIDLFTVCSIGRRTKRQEMALARSRRKAALLKQISGNTSRTSTSASTVAPDMNTRSESTVPTLIEPKIPKLMKMAAASGEVIPMTQLINATEDMNETRTISAMSSSVSNIETATSRRSTQIAPQLRNFKESKDSSGVSTPTEVEQIEVVPNGRNNDQTIPRAERLQSCNVKICPVS